MRHESGSGVVGFEGWASIWRGCLRSLEVPFLRVAQSECHFRQSRVRPRNLTRGAVVVIVGVLLAPSGLDAIYPKVSLAEVAQTADIIFAGTVLDIRSRLVGSHGAIATDVSFGELDVVSWRSPEAAQSTVQLTFAGGEVGNQRFQVEDAPKFIVGNRYLLFALADGKVYLNPLVGGPQGLFQVVRDAATGEEVPLSLGGNGIRAVAGGEVELTSALVESVRNGVAQWRTPSVLSLPVADPKGANPGMRSRSTREVEAPELLDLQRFENEVRRLVAAPPVERRLRFGGGAAASPPLPAGGMPKQSVPNASLSSGADPLHFVPRSTDEQELFPPASEPAICSDDIVEGGTPLCYCGYHWRYIVMEQMPAASVWFTQNNDAMWQYNQFMDNYRYVDDDGSWGHNGENEFGGFPSDADLIAAWGFQWNGALAMTTQAWSGDICAAIDESDIVFNPAYEWWTELDDTLGNSQRVLYRSVLMHELGHSWGMQRGSCTEDYSYSLPSVMHAYYSDVVEDGWGIHFWDSTAIRQLYQSQTGVLPRKDVGAESYYADFGLVSSSTDLSEYRASDPITVSGMTVENMSNAATPDVRIRLYLSTNRTISASDHQMGGFWSWASFPAESYWSGDLTTQVPNVPAGTYYVGIIVTTDGDAWSYDDLSFNNATFLPGTITVTDPCVDDEYELLGSGGSDDSCFGASIGIDTPQIHSHCDEDWVYFFAAEGESYIIETSNLLGSSDTMLDLYQDCTTWLAGNDDWQGLASRIEWTAPASGFFDVQVREFGSAYGPNLGYSISVAAAGLFRDGFESGDTTAWN